MHRYFDREGFVEIIVPRVTKITGSCENLDTLLDVEFLGQQAYLIQTAQLFLELLVPALPRVWCCGPSFRAEAKIDNRHLAEFTLLEMEFCGDFEELLSRIENLLSEMINRVVERCEKELGELGANKRGLHQSKPPFQRVTYDQAVQVLNVSWGDDLNSKHERILLEKHGCRPLFITHFLEHIKFFNMKINQENPKVVDSADLILPFSGEAAGAAEREFDYEKVYNRLKRSNMLKQLERRGGSIDDFHWYLNHLQGNGSVRHAGCGVGLNRVIQFILGSHDIRESTLFSSRRGKLM